MTDSLKMYEFLLGQKPICTQTPIKYIIGREKYRELRAQYKAELDIDLLADRCDNTFNCKAVNTGCIGRPFPKDTLIYQALKQINVDISEGTHKGKDVYFAKATVDCADCPFKADCENPCVTQDSYIRRSMKPDLSPQGDMLVSYDDYEAGLLGPALIQATEDNSVPTDMSWVDKTLPLDCLTNQQLRIVEGITNDGKTNLEMAKEIGCYPSLISRQYDNAVTKMADFGKARLAIKEHGAPERVKLYYIYNFTHREIADKESCGRSSITMSINKWKAKYL